MEVHFTVPGEPQGKGRPRASKLKNGDLRMRTPDNTVSYENLIKLAYDNQCNYRFDDKTALHMSVIATYSIPMSISKKKRQQMIDGFIRPIKKPDSDNVLKVVADSLNQIAYRDDAQIASIVLNKYYGEKPGLTVYIRVLELPF
ncbi:MAG: Holliday junction resolvase [Clostridia bacterium]|jgi:Holliday junction resolvase RusA-like endonuclease|nr:Holliday junction resolvase [Clostridia bacterium]